jgi:cytochrome c-type biogenesis protein CcmH
VKIVFYAIAAAMIAVALVALLLPLMRHGRQARHPRGVFTLALLVAFALPLVTAGLYLLVGTPAALNGVTAPTTAPISMQQAVTELRAHLTQQPDDLPGWLLLAQTDTMLRNPTAARDAYGHALQLDANNVEAMLGWAETDSMARSDHLITGRALDLLKRAVLLQPDSQRGLWLLGISDFQHDRYREAASTWRLLQPQLEPGSNVAKAIAEQIAVADARAGGAPASAASSNATADATHGASLQVQVALAPALQSRLAAGDAVFVYARAPSGPPMPLAVVKLDASQLPTTVTLTDAMALTPERKLSSMSQVFVGARISRSGQAVAQSGDLEGDTGVVAVDRQAPVKLSIDKVH